MSALTTVLVFLELSDDRAVDPDAAVMVMESVAAELHQLGEAERAALVDYWRSLARENIQDQRLRRFYEELSSSMGLTENE